MFSFFKKEKINIWNVLAQELNGVFIPAKYDECAKTEIVYKDWKIILDNYINYIDVGNSSTENGILELLQNMKLQMILDLKFIKKDLSDQSKNFLVHKI